MAKDIDITLPDGGEITVPGWSTEETQKQIYTLLKSMQGVSKDTVKKLEEAQREDNRNEQKQLEALKDLRKDLQKAHTFGFLGAMAAAAGAAGKGLGFLGKAVGVTAGAVTAMGGALAYGVTQATQFATAYTDALQPLVDSGMAFGSLGKQIDDSILDLNRLGFSSAEAAKLINNSSTAFLRLGSKGLSEFTKNMDAAAGMGLRFGLAQDEATEYLLTELEERARSGIVERMNSTQFAAMQFQVLEDQINASRRLGKTIDEIADIQKDVMGDDRLTAIMSTFSGDQQAMMKELAANLSAYGLSSGEIADIMSAELQGRGMEGTDVGASLIGEMSQIPDGFKGLADSVGAQMDAIRTNDRASYESAEGALFENMELVGRTIRESNEALKDGYNTSLVIYESTNTRLLGMAPALEAAGKVGEVQKTQPPETNEFETAVNTLVGNSKKLDTALLDLAGALTAQATKSQQALAETVGIIADTVTPHIPGIQDFAEGVGDTAANKIKEFNTSLSGFLTDLNTFTDRIQKIFDAEGMSGIADRVAQAAVDYMVVPLAKAIGSIFTNPEVIAAAVAGIGALMLAMRTSVAGLPGIGAGGPDNLATGGAPDGKDIDDKDGKGKGSRFAGKGARAIIGGAGGALLSGALEIAELAGDIDDINKDLVSGKITRSEAEIAKSAEKGEAAGGMGGAAGGAAAGAALGSAVPLVGTAIGALIGGGIGWYLGRAGGRAMGEGLGEAVFTPEQEALEAELLKIEERLGGNINNRTKSQLETRKKQVEAELALMKPIEQSTPASPNNIPIMTQQVNEDGTFVSNSDSAETAAKKEQSIQEQVEQMQKQYTDHLNELIKELKTSADTQNMILQKISSNTGKTNSNLSAIADTQ